MKNKPYFPFFLGNGVDGVLINYSGSMFSQNYSHRHVEQHQGLICAWYKATHRSLKNYNVTKPILQSTYNLISGYGEYDVGDFTQSFDPKIAVLTTILVAYDFKVKIETFLTKEQVLVEHYTLLKVSKNKPEIALNLHPPIGDGMSKESYKLYPNIKEKTIVYSYTIDDVNGIGIMYTDFPRIEKIENLDTWCGIGKRMFLTGLKENISFTKYVVVIDEKDTKDYKKHVNHIVSKIRKNGYKSILEEHKKEWLEYQNKSCLGLPDKELEYVYNLSLYLVKANQHPKTGFISTGNYQLLWGGGNVNHWDAIFPFTALLGSNRIKEAGKLISFYPKIMKEAEEYAKGMKVKGAFFPSGVNPLGETTFPKKLPKHLHNDNAYIVKHIWDYYLLTGDKKMLEESWRLIKELTDFNISDLVEMVGNVAKIKEANGMEETYVPVKNDTTQLLITIRAVEAVINSAKILNKNIGPHYGIILKSLNEGLKNNYKGKILMYYEGANKVIALIFLFYLFNLPEGIPKEGIEAALKRCQGKFGLTDNHVFQNLIWPWWENISAITLAYLKDKRAMDRIYNGLKYTSSLGAFPEKIRPDAYPLNYWYVSPHGAYVWALNTMLVNTINNEIRILPTIPDDWKDIEFKNIRIQPGILVSLKMEKGKIVRLKLENCTTETINRVIVFGKSKKNISVLLKPKQKLLIPKS